MKKLMIGSLLSAAMFSAVSAHAATAELKVIGTIAPAACVPNFTGGATIDYGNIGAGTLNAAAQTNLPDKSTVINVTCDSPAIFYLKSVDDRAGTVAAGVTPPNGSATASFGLGTASDGSNIGAYTLQLTGETAGSGSTGRLSSLNGGTSWAAFGGLMRNDGTQLIGFHNGTATTVPGAHSSITANISVRTSLARAAALPLTEEINLDGLAVVEVVYP